MSEADGNLSPVEKSVELSLAHSSHFYACRGLDIVIIESLLRVDGINSQFMLIP